MRILIIDLAALFYPAWHATSDADGRGAFDRTIKACRDLQAMGWDRVAVCVDAGDSGRKEILPEYKANRREKEAALLEQLRRAQEFLAKDGFHVLRGEGFEADDTIATVCAWADQRDDIEEVVIAGADKDLLQLVGGKVTFLNAQTGKVLDPIGVAEKMGVPPVLVPDLLALVGDTADNIPGCPQVGMKTAAALLQEFGTLDDVLEAAQNMKAASGVVQDNLFSHQDICRKSRNLIRLRTNAPVDPEVILTEPVKEDQEPEAEAEPPPPAVEASVVEMPKKKPDGFDDMTSSALATVDFSMELEPRNMKQAHWVAQKVIGSRLFNGYGTPESALMCILAGREFGISAMASLRGFHVIEGKLSMSAQLIAAVIIKSGKAEYFEPVLAECNSEQATWITKRKGRPEQRFTYTLALAKKAGLLAPSRSGKPSNWDKRPDTMMRWRACVELGRAIYPDIVGNVYTEADWNTEAA